MHLADKCSISTHILTRYRQLLPNKANVLGFGTFLVLLFSLFGGFMVTPNTIPSYFLWLYWLNPVAWAFQALLINEFNSDKYASLPRMVNLATLFEKSDPALIVFLQTCGFKSSRVWIVYSFVFLIPYILLCAAVLAFVLHKVRLQPSRNAIKMSQAVPDDDANSKEFDMPFTPVDVTFESLFYDVKASTGDEVLRLLNGVCGAFRAGRMVALMGSSGAGKTTLMDVISLRKTSGTLTGEVRLNGFLQERVSFLRCSGYVEQFDVQQAQLTVRETVVFSARLRLDSRNPATATDEGKLRFVDHVLKMLELNVIKMLQVGNYEEGGLTFEQRKRLAIAVELCASPSVIFLDEPTSGLDSRGALIIMRAMKRIADTGRTVSLPSASCIHTRADTF
jgi:ABC-type lipoprotein export system ATPase subunit